MAEYKTLFMFFMYLVRLATYTVYCACWLSIWVLDCIINVFVLANHKSPLKAAKVGRIWWRKKYVPMLGASPLDFLCIFTTRVRPEYILKPNVSLYAITNKEAIFVETPNEINIYSSEVHPFLLPAQYCNATHVIKMPITDFVSLADRIGDPKVPVIWMSSTGRCGGTMLSQVFESVPGTQAIHQPDTPTNVYVLREYDKIDKDDYEMILKSMVRILCKPHPGIERICIKPRPPCTSMMIDISKLFPDIRQLFIYRNSFETIRSYSAVMASDPYPVVMCNCADTEWFSKISPHFRNKQVYYLISKRNDLPDVPYDVPTVCVMSYAWASQMNYVRDAKSQGHNILPVKYEDIISRPREMVEQIFEATGVAEIHIDRALSSLGRDSQRGSMLSQNKIREAANFSLSTMDRKKVDAILSSYNLPPMGEDFRV